MAERCGLDNLDTASSAKIDIMTTNYLGLPDGAYYSPKIVIYEFSQLIKHTGQNVVFGERKYQADRELWIASLFALGISANGKEQYWVGYGKDNTPDAEIVAFKESEYLEGKGRDLEVTPLEIMEYEDHALNFEEELMKKLNKQYPANFHLLVFATKEEEYQHDQLVEVIKKHKPNLAAIWLLGGNMKQMNLWELYPNPQWIKYNAIAIANTIPNSDIISLKRGTGYDAVPKKDVPRKIWD